jgi:hypothetical protein
MYNKSEDKDENQDKEIERAEKYYGDLPPDTESKDLVSNDVDDLEEAVDKNMKTMQAIYQNALPSFLAAVHLVALIAGLSKTQRMTIV